MIEPRRQREIVTSTFPYPYVHKEHEKPSVRKGSFFEWEHEYENLINVKSTNRHSTTSYKYLSLP